jgi:plasmid stability protein
MTAADPPEGAPGRWAVKIRASASHWWTSPWLLEDEARAIARGLRRDLGNLTQGPGFVEFRASGGREVSIRARDIVAVELVPWHEGRPQQPVAAAVGGVVQPLPMLPPAPPGTEWLRRQASAEQVSAR